MEELTKSKQNELLDALNHLDELADIGSDYEEKSDQAKSYSFLYNFIISLKTKK
jgi:hypothetical protein